MVDILLYGAAKILFGKPEKEITLESLASELWKDRLFSRPEPELNDKDLQQFWYTDCTEEDLEIEQEINSLRFAYGVEFIECIAPSGDIVLLEPMDEQDIGLFEKIREYSEAYEIYNRKSFKDGGLEDMIEDWYLMYGIDKEHCWALYHNNVMPNAFDWAPLVTTQRGLE